MSRSSCIELTCSRVGSFGGFVLLVPPALLGLLAARSEAATAIVVVASVDILGGHLERLAVLPDRALFEHTL